MPKGSLTKLPTPLDKALGISLKLCPKPPKNVPLVPAPLIALMLSPMLGPVLNGPATVNSDNGLARPLATS